MPNVFRFSIEQWMANTLCSVDDFIDILHNFEQSNVKISIVFGKKSIAFEKFHFIKQCNRKIRMM